MSTLNLGKDNLILDSDYSTEEKPTGATWIDGKPIYRKVLTHAGWTTNPSTIDNIVIGAISSNFDKIVHMSGSAKNVGNYIEIPYIVGTTSGGHLWTVTVWIPSGTSDVNVQVTCASTGATFTDVQVVVCYTKTTD